ncbi:hypothetical protein ACHAXA_006031 [Cyclostephanos tholiformis]|uniref:Kinesin motor domain-containing protein n=1 Tax=Cyclostephanos tholiformis TaxID=382380 RepID=A0ABD3RAL8_9STRA
MVAVASPRHSNVHQQQDSPTMTNSGVEGIGGGGGGGRYAPAPPKRHTSAPAPLALDDDDNAGVVPQPGMARPSSSPEGRSADGSADLDRKGADTMAASASAIAAVEGGGGREGIPLTTSTSGEGGGNEGGGSHPPANKIPKNPRDTAHAHDIGLTPQSPTSGGGVRGGSPKRRSKVSGPLHHRTAAGAGGGGSGGSIGGVGQVGGGGEGSGSIGARSVPTTSAWASRSLVPPHQSPTNPVVGGRYHPHRPGAASSVGGPPAISGGIVGGVPAIVVGGGNAVASSANNNSNNVLAAALDDDEQFMFEQRLAHDELGVAIRKISHSGKAQLRYVKCVPVRPPSSSDYYLDENETAAPAVARGGGVTVASASLRGGINALNKNNINNNGAAEGGSIANGSRPGIAPYLERQPHGCIVGVPPYLSATASRIPSDSMSVTSRSSTGSRRFIEKMRSGLGGSGVILRNSRLLNKPGGVGGGVSMASKIGASASHDGRTPTSAIGGGGAVVGTESLLASVGNVVAKDDDEGIDDSSNNLLLNDDAAAGMMIDMLADGGRSHRALTWGKKNAVVLSLDKFTCVRKGKTTERTMRNSSPSSRLLSIMTNVRGNESLDIEAPTMLDRDKFASAFARFLGVPLLEEKDVVVGGGDGGGGVSRAGRSMASVGTAGFAKKKIRTPSLTRPRKKSAPLSGAQSEPGSTVMPSQSATTSILAMRDRSMTNTSDSLLPKMSPNSDDAENTDNELVFDPGFWDGRKQIIGSSGAMGASRVALSPAVVASSAVKSRSVSSRAGDTVMTKQTIETMSESARKRISLDGDQERESMLEPRMSMMQDATTISATQRSTAVASVGMNNQVLDDTDNHSHVSSLTGGVDQEIVEELHQAIIELRAELDASRAEAARAVKVAEQAIQSAENCTSSDWNSTVTHKAAEAAAQAQRRSAEAIARARIAEERLNSERKSTTFWRRQAQAAEEEAGSLKTRSAAAEVRQAVIMEELASEKRKAARMFASLKNEFQEAEKKQEAEVAMILERKTALEVELEQIKNDFDQKIADAKRESEIEGKEKSKGQNRMRPNFRRLHSGSPQRPKESSDGSIISSSLISKSLSLNLATKERFESLRQELVSLRKQFELVRRTSVDEILLLRRQSENWSKQASRAITAVTAETDFLREKFAAEAAMRLKLLNALQDIRGTVRVYCRPKPSVRILGSGASKPIFKIPTHDTLVLNEDSSPISFKYDRVFSPGASQYEVFSELEEPLISSLDGFNVTLLAFGQGGSGKTHTLLGDVVMDENGNDLPTLKSYGVQLQAILQLFTIAGHRTDRYKDAFSMTIVEVHNEKLFDLLACTRSAEKDGEIIMCETRDRQIKRRESGSEAWPKGKLEIRTNIDGNTVVQGLVSIPIKSFEDVLKIWQESIANRAEQVRRQGSDWEKHGRKTNVITTIHVTSVNIATGVGTEGRLQFVDMAASDVAQSVSKVKENFDAKSCIDEEDTQFANKSIVAFNEVINARCQFDRSVPYRNSTLTHLLRDSLEADTKVLLLCCVSSDESNIEDTISALRFASRIQKVSIGKATKHVTGSKE